MKDLKHLIAFDDLLQEANNKLVRQAKEEGLKALGDCKPVSGVASAEQLGRLSRHIRRRLSDMAKELRQGSIAADPYFRSGTDNACQFCEFYEACQFSDGENGERCRYLPRLSDGKVWENIDGEVAGDA